MKQSGTLVASVSLLIGILLMAHPSPAASASPREQLDDFFRTATTVLGEASQASEAQHEIRHSRDSCSMSRARRAACLSPNGVRSAWSNARSSSGSSVIASCGDTSASSEANCLGIGLRPFALSVKRWARAGVSRSFAP